MSATFRIDAGLIYTTADVFKVDVGAGFLDVDLSAAIGGIDTPPDTNATDIAANIQAHLNDVASGFTVTESNGKYTISNAALFSLSFTHLSLREFLGFTSATYNNVTTATSETQSAGVYIGGRPAYATPGFRWYTKRSAQQHGKARSLLLSAREIFDCVVRVQNSELSAWRDISDYMLKGQPFRFYQSEDAASANGFNATIVGATNQGGMIDGFLDASQQSLSDNWLTNPYQSEVSIDFQMIKAV